MKEDLDELETDDLVALAELCQVDPDKPRSDILEALRECIGRDNNPPPATLMDTRLVAIRSARSWTGKARSGFEEALAKEASSLRGDITKVQAEWTNATETLETLKRAVFGDAASQANGVQKDVASLKSDLESLKKSSRRWEVILALVGAFGALGGGSWVYHTYERLKTAQERLAKLSEDQEAAITKVKDEGGKAAEQLAAAAEVHRKHVGSQVLSRCLLVISSASVSRDDAQQISRQLEEERAALQALKSSALLGPHEIAVCELSDRVYEALQRLIRLDNVPKRDDRLSEISAVAAHIDGMGTRTKEELAKSGTYSGSLYKLETRRLNLLGILSLHRWYLSAGLDDLTEAERHFRDAVGREPEFWRARNNVAVAVIERYYATKSTLNPQECRLMLQSCEDSILAARSRNPSPKYDSMLTNNLASVRMECVKLLGRTSASSEEITEAVKRARETLQEARVAAIVHEAVDLTEAELMCVERSVGVSKEAEETFEKKVVELVRGAGVKLGVRAQFQTPSAFLRSCDGFGLCGQSLLTKILLALGYSP